MAYLPKSRPSVFQPEAIAERTVIQSLSKGNMVTFNKSYAILALLLFMVEVLIALYVKDNFIRPYVGDYLVVIFLYCLVRGFLNISVRKAAMGVLVFAYIIEILQYLEIVRWLGLRHSQLANVVIGNLFEWMDLIAYTAGILTVLITETLRIRSTNGFSSGSSNSGGKKQG